MAKKTPKRGDFVQRMKQVVDESTAEEPPVTVLVYRPEQHTTHFVQNESGALTPALAERGASRTEG